MVVCAAVGASELRRHTASSCRLASVYGYPVTAPLRRLEAHPDIGPRSAVMDDRYKVDVSRFGSRVRVAGGVEIGGNPQQHKRAALDTLYKVLNDWFPGAAHMSQAQVWKGSRPMLPDGPRCSGQAACPACGSTSATATTDGHWHAVGAFRGRRCGFAHASSDVEGLGVERLRRLNGPTGMDRILPARNAWPLHGTTNARHIEQLALAAPNRMP